MELTKKQLKKQERSLAKKQARIETIRILSDDKNPNCFYCKTKLSSSLKSHNITFDHKIPKSKGGQSTIDNLVLSCVNCNQLKSDMDFDAFVKLYPKLVSSGYMKLSKTQRSNKNE